MNESPPAIAPAATPALEGAALTYGNRAPWGTLLALPVASTLAIGVHLFVAKNEPLIEGRSCEKFQILATSVRDLDPGLADFYASLVESEGNHYATYLIMARHIDGAEADRRLDFFLELDARLTREPNPLPMLH